MSAGQKVAHSLSLVPSPHLPNGVRVPGSARVWNLLSWITLQYQKWGGYHVWIFVMQKGGNLFGFFANKLLGVSSHAPRSASKSQDDL
jgi:hypothetical protein